MLFLVLLRMRKSIFLFLFASALYALPQFSEVQKEKLLYPLGKKIYKKRCSDIRPKKYASIDGLYRYIKEHCRFEEERYNIALAYYLWNGVQKKRERIRFSYSKTDRCPVCGMFIYKYPKWVAMMEAKNGEKLYFDCVKDAMKYYFKISNGTFYKLYGQDYYSKKIFDLRKGYFVVGSDIYGPMGNELVPFDKFGDAQKFFKEHKGVFLLRFDQLSPKFLKVGDE